MKTLLFALGFVTALSIWGRIPHYVGTLLADQPVTPLDWSPKHYHYTNGVRDDTA